MAEEGHNMVDNMAEEDHNMEAITTDQTTEDNMEAITTDQITEDNTEADQEANTVMVGSVEAPVKAKVKPQPARSPKTLTPTLPVLLESVLPFLEERPLPILKLVRPIKETTTEDKAGIFITLMS